MKKKLMIVTDSYFVLTGFANVGRHISDYIAKDDDYDITYFGWFEPKGKKIIEPNKKIKYANTASYNYRVLEQDKYGAVSFPELYTNRTPPTAVSAWTLKSRCPKLKDGVLGS